jgi:hypothetical protein
MLSKFRVFMMIQNHENENVLNIGKGEARNRNCNELEDNGGHGYERSSV